MRPRLFAGGFRTAVAWGLVAAAVVALSSVVRAGPPPRGPAPAQIHGIVVSIQPAAGVLSVRPEGGSRPVVVRVPPGVVIAWGGGTLALSDVRAGDRVHIWALPAGGAWVALRIEVLGREAVRAAGVPDLALVVERRGPVLVLLHLSGQVRLAFLSPEARVAGARTRADDIRPYDVVRLAGPMGADGSLIATSVAVEYAAPERPAARGAITAVGRGVVLMGPIVVSVGPQTFVVRDGRRLAPADLRPGLTVGVWGPEVRIGPRVVAVDARAIVVE
ncbi:MAG: hypothetical protein QN163_03980 [Armatimonadota bacterium]|nr:hypothetical protein [Armatimonadota bacterium]MDR5696851.1 hypothetical protein [Armatimonadota bacterium]